MNMDGIAPILERLDAIEARLLGSERLKDDDQDSQVAIHLLFRDFHNLKSSLSMAGAEALAHLVHEAESCLDALRSGKGDPRSAWADALLSVVDHARANAGSGNDVGAPELSRSMQGLLASWETEPAGTGEVGFPLESGEAANLKAELDSGASAYVLEKVIAEGMSAEEAATLPVFDSIAEIGKAIASRINHIQGAGALLTVLFTSKIERSELAFSIFDPFHPVSADSPAVSAKKAAGSAPPARKLTRILIVEDEPTSLMLLQIFLVPYGRIDTAENGDEALAKIGAAIGSGEPYDVVFLDIMIPGTQGHEVLKRTRELEASAGIQVGTGAKVVMESSLSDYASISASFRNQGDAYLVKPIDAETIRKTMEKFNFAKVAAGSA